MERRAANRSDDDVYIIKVERNLFKVDQPLLQQIPKLRQALEAGELRLGRPYDLEVPCQPRVAKDVLHLLKRQTNGLDPFDGFQSAQLETGRAVLELVQLLQLADSLEIERLASTIVDKIRILCVNIDGLHKALKGTRFEKYIFLNRSLDKIFSNRTTLRKGNDGTNSIEPVSRLQSKAGEYLLGLSGKSAPAEKTATRKRKLSCVEDGVGTTQSRSVYKKLKPTILVESSPSPDLQPADMSVLESFQNSSQAADNDQSHSEQDRMDEMDFEIDDDGMGVDEDDFERDQDDVDVVEPDSFEFDEDEVTSGDVEELILSDPIKFECIASPQNSRKTQKLTAEGHHVSSLEEPSPLSDRTKANDHIFHSRNTKTPTDSVPTSKLRLLPVATPNQSCQSQPEAENVIKEQGSALLGYCSSQSSSQSWTTEHFDLENFVCKALSSSGCGSRIKATNDRVLVFHPDKSPAHGPSFTLPYSKILQFKVSEGAKEQPVVQVLLRTGVIPSNICYLRFKSQSELIRFVDEVRQRYESLRVIPMAPGSAENLLSAALAACDRERKTKTLAEKYGIQSGSNIASTETSDEGKTAQKSNLAIPRRRSDFNMLPPWVQRKDSKTSPGTPNMKKKLFNQETPFLSDNLRTLSQQKVTDHEENSSSARARKVLWAFRAARARLDDVQ